MVVFRLISMKFDYLVLEIMELVCFNIQSYKQKIYSVVGYLDTISLELGQLVLIVYNIFLTMLHTF